MELGHFDQRGGPDKVLPKGNGMPRQHRFRLEAEVENRRRRHEAELVTPHTSGQVPFAGRRLMMAEENGGELPPMTKLTHRKKDETFVDAWSEEIYNEAMTRIAGRETHITLDGTIQVPLTVLKEVKIFEKVSPRKKGRILWMGSIRDCPVASSSGSHTYEDPAQLRQELATANAEITSLRDEQVVQKQKISEINGLFDVIAAAVPQLAVAIRERQRRSRSLRGASSVRSSDQDQTSAPVVQMGNDGTAASG
ncbi:uncharacterized protein LOC112084477 [Eutrema salsugineum]|uniref:uncharacterized protein LOC112084477 n=1 Tax=Eutrema salsugineum TaxID=72664 RepID=UPI000CED3FDE|nr:uncharacterized protein LOC112084477 [Eutrema salsugineum]